MTTLKRINTVLSFLLEIAMFAAFIYWGFRTGESVWLKWVLAIGVPLMVFIVWGLLLAPQARERVKGTAGIVVSLLLFYLAALALFHARQPALGSAMLITAALNRTLAVMWKQW